MINTIIISIDTERDQPIVIAKPQDIAPPANAEEAKEMILNDINCMVSALSAMIDVADYNKYGNKKELVEDAILKLHALIAEKPEVKSTQPEENDTEK